MYVILFSFVIIFNGSWMYPSVKYKILKTIIWFVDFLL